jgi:hypothetical protein
VSAKLASEVSIITDVTQDALSTSFVMGLLNFALGTASRESDPLVRKKYAALLDCFSNRYRARVDADLALRIDIRLRVKFLRIKEFRDNILSPDNGGLSRLSL